MKAQIKMGETMAILVIFFFLLMFGFKFYTNIQEVTMKSQKDINLQLRIIKLYQRASFMTEFQCSFKDISVDNCYDSHKIRAFANVITTNPEYDGFYFNMFGDSEVHINEIYPGKSDYTIYKHPVDDFIYKDIVTLPISIYNASSAEFSFGLLNVTVYSR